VIGMFNHSALQHYIDTCYSGSWSLCLFSYGWMSQFVWHHRRTI